MRAARKVNADVAQPHVYARVLVGQLLLDKERAARSDARGLEGAIKRVRQLTEFYPQHIATEDKSFFLPATEYLTADEKTQMLEDFAAFDRRLVHERYRVMVEEFEERRKE